MGGTGGGKGKGNGSSIPAEPPAAEQDGGEHPAHHGEASGQQSFGFQRGLDSGLAKAAPTAEGLNAKTYRAYRRRLLLFAKQCGRRGQSVSVEGAFLAISLLQDTAWDATEQLNLDEVEAASDPFKPIFTLLDRLYQHEEDVELPARCEEFFQEFGRLKNEEMQAYLLRHATLNKKLREVGIALPDLLAGWHLLTRAGVPKWTHLQVKALCGGTLEYQKVAQALLKVFGGDHRPNVKDLFRSAGDTAQAYANETFDDVYLHEDLDEGWGDYGYYDVPYEDEIYWEDDVEANGEGDLYHEDDANGDDLEIAAEAVEEAYMNYADSRRRMRDIALSRGFFPVVAMPPADWSPTARTSEKGKSKGKGRGKSKGKAKGKGKSGDKGFRHFAFSRRPTSGLRRDAAANLARPSTDSSRSTGSGSTAGHGPRFKRYRLQDATKPVEEANVVEEMYANNQGRQTVTEENVEVHQAENVFFSETGPGYAILDSGATKSVIGELTWQKWLELFARCGVEATAKKSVRDFRFGDGSTVRSSIEVTFPAMVFGRGTKVTASLIPGNTPLLLARPVLEEWQMVQDFATGKIRLFGDETWHSPGRTSNGHFIQLVKEIQDDKMHDVLATAYVETPLESQEGASSSEMSERSRLEDTSGIQAAILMAEEVVYFGQGDKKKIFWELFVDQGCLSHAVAQYPGMECSTFSSPEWDFEQIGVQKAFLELMCKVMPSHVWLAPSSCVWNPMQNMNARTEAQARNIMLERKRLMRTQTSFAAQVFQTALELSIFVTIEHPDGSAMWSTAPMRALTGYFDAVVDRCRTGLVARNQAGVAIGPVKKSTRLRTTSARMAETMDLRCQCEGSHLQTMGRGQELRSMQNYERGFVRLAADAVVQDSEVLWAQRQAAMIFMTDDLPYMIPDQEHSTESMNKNLVRKLGRSSVLTVAKLHKQLGHPGRERLVQAARDSGLDAQTLQAAREYRCATCEVQNTSKLARPGTLNNVTCFNQVVLLDAFFIKWNDKKHSILAIMDSFSRYEQMTRLEDDRPETEIKLIESAWLRWAGPPAVIKTDASGSHMSETFVSWTDSRGIKLIIIPKEAHYRLGAMERAHAVRRAQLMKMKAEDPAMELDMALHHAAEQRNRLRTVHGTSPATIVFGILPAQHSIDDEPFNPAAGDEEAQARVVKARTLAATAFHQANNDRVLRAAVLARGAPPLPQVDVGQFCYYYRQDNKLAPEGRWRGPALVCAIEEPSSPSPPAARPGSLVYWLAHGSSLVRCAPEQVRVELPLERARRLLESPETEATVPCMRRVRAALRPVRGPVRYLDLTARAAPAIAGAAAQEDEPEDYQDTPDAPMQQTEDQDSQRNHVREIPNDKLEILNDKGDIPTDKGEAQSIETDASQEQDPRKKPANEQKTPMGHSDVIVPQAAQSSSSTRRERSRSPPRAKTSKYTEEQLQEGIDRARRMDGLPPARRESRVPEADEDVTMDMAFEDEILMVASELNERNMTDQEKKDFDVAKDEALIPWIHNAAWEPVDAKEAREGEAVPVRFLLKYKEKDGKKKANARLILQGFRHVDVTSKKLETESPTLSKGSRSLIMLLCCQMGWKIFSADVKSAFLQSDDIDQEIRLFAVPNRDIRKRLARLMDLKDFQILRILKPAFGDVRAPRQWYTTADRVNREELTFARHKLDRCVYLSCRQAQEGDDPFRVFNKEGVAMVMDGVLGVHVDDVVGGGEHVNAKEDAQDEGPEEALCFRDRVQRLLRRFKFGSIDFSYDQVFCGVNMQQSFGHDAVKMNLKKYVHHIKPIAVEKARKQMVGDVLDEREVAKLRSLLGALAWPATQCIPMLSASVSLMQSAMSAPTVNDLLEANKTLRFAKETVERYEWSVHRHGDLSRLCFAAYTDAAWAVRPDGSSQGGYVIFAASLDEVNSGKPFRLTTLEWGSKKLARVCRSSLAAETQAAATCVDELEWLKTCWHLMLWPNAEPLDDDMAKITPSFVVTDAKSLYDAANSMSAGLKLSERRSAIELAGTNERLKAIGGHWRWCNSSQQLADGLTKAAARAACLEAFARGVVNMRFDEAMTAAKKVTKQARQAELKELDQAALELNDVNVNVLEAALPRCRLFGCERVVNDADTTGHRYCSRRHYYRAMSGGDGERTRALIAAATLATQVSTAEGYVVLSREDEHIYMIADIRVVSYVIVALVVVFVSWWFNGSTTSPRSQEASTTTATTSSSTTSTSSTPSTPTSPTKRSEQGVQAEDLRNPEAERLREELTQRNGQAMRDEAERVYFLQHIDELNERINDLQWQLQQARAMEIPMPSSRPRAPDRIYMTPSGRRYHLRDECGHVRGHNGVKVFTLCGDCSR